MAVLLKLEKSLFKMKEKIFSIGRKETYSESKVMFLDKLTYLLLREKDV